jgi:hypothetical protein
MNILDKAVAHFDKLGTKKIKVPEWDSVIYATPFTLSEKRTLLQFSKGNDAEFMVRTLIMKALDKDGKKVFDLSEKPTLMSHTHSGIIERVVGEIIAAISIKEAEEK